MPRRKEIKSPLDAWLLKEEVAEELRKVLGPRRARRVAKDPHARRKPRPCGITVHPAQGCSLGCLYCYVPDMGFPTKPRPYHLSGEELAYALAVNPHVVPGRTLAAFGSVTEPFLPEVVEKTLEYLRAVNEWLSLPCQVSTKLVIDKELAAELARAEPRLSVLISATTTRKAKILEPGAPPPQERIAGGGNVMRAGLRADLFLRPLIPGVTNEDDIRELLHLAKQQGLKGVVAGSLRLTPTNLRRLSLAGADTNELMKLARLKQPPKPGTQVPVSTTHLKETVKREAKKQGLQYLPAACAANTLSHKLNCYLCRLGPCVTGKKHNLMDEDIESPILELLNHLGIRNANVNIATKGSEKPRVEVIGVPKTSNRKMLNLQSFLQEFLKVHVAFR